MPWIFLLIPLVICIIGTFCADDGSNPIFFAIGLALSIWFFGSLINFINYPTILSETILTPREVNGTDIVVVGAQAINLNLKFGRDIKETEKIKYTKYSNFCAGIMWFGPDVDTKLEIVNE
jgi:hypothetical protein